MQLLVEIHVILPHRCTAPAIQHVIPANQPRNRHHGIKTQDSRLSCQGCAAKSMCGKEGCSRPSRPSSKPKLDICSLKLQERIRTVFHLCFRCKVLAQSGRRRSANHSQSQAMPMSSPECNFVPSRQRFILQMNRNQPQALKRPRRF